MGWLPWALGGGVLLLLLGSKDEARATGALVNTWFAQAKAVGAGGLGVWMPSGIGTSEAEVRRQTNSVKKYMPPGQQLEIKVFQAMPASNNAWIIWASPEGAKMLVAGAATLEKAEQMRNVLQQSGQPAMRNMSITHEWVPSGFFANL